MDFPQKEEDISSGFDKAAGALPKTDFVRYLQDFFMDEATTRAVLDTFQKMGLPAPESMKGVVTGSEGALVFLNRYGVVIRIERKVAKSTPVDISPVRIDDSAWILKPLASIDSGEVIIEICPGVHPEKDEKKETYLAERLDEQGIYFWDCGIRNIGLVPIEKTARFPEGRIPLVIDRGAVERLSEDIAPVRRSLEVRQEMREEAREAEEAQEELYAPLRDAFDAAWPDKSGLPDALKMKQFWKLCERYVEEGKLVAGWNEERNRICAKKTREAIESAEIYETLLKSAEQTVTPSAAVVPQSPHQPV
ncbi:MAG: hypothetical protein V1721_02145 [Pseudomonadota bacterium]